MRSQRPDLRVGAAALLFTVTVAGLVALTLNPLYSALVVDLDVYRMGGRAVLAGQDLYEPTPTFAELLRDKGAAPLPLDQLPAVTRPVLDRLLRLRVPFTYPPFAALLFAPLGLVNLVVAQLVMVLASLLALLGGVRLTLRQLVPGWSAQAGWAAALTLTPALLLLEPVRSTVRLGQVNLVLLAMVALDVLQLVPPRWRGVLTGLAAGIKVTPALFVAHYLLARRWRDAAVAAGTGLATVAVGALVAPGPTLAYFTGHLFRTERVGDASLLENQSLYGGWVRWLGTGPTSTGLWLGSAVLVAGVGLWAARRADLAGESLLALGLVGAVMLLVSPISWGHHWVWLLPAVAVLVLVPPERAGRGWRVRPVLAALILVPLVVGCANLVPDAPFLQPYRAHGLTVLTSSALALATVVLLGYAAVRAHRTAFDQRATSSAALPRLVVRRRLVKAGSVTVLCGGNPAPRET